MAVLPGGRAGRAQAGKSAARAQRGALARGQVAMAGQHGDAVNSDPMMSAIVFALLVLLVIVLILAA